MCFDRKYGKGRWMVRNWFVRDVSARVSKMWPKQLQTIMEDTKSNGATLAAATVCRMLRNARDFLAVRDSAIPLLFCEHDGLDTTTARGRNQFGKFVLDAEMEAELCSERVRKALAVAKRRGKKLGSHNKKVKGKGAKAMHNKAMDLARRLAKHTKPLVKKSFGARRVKGALNLLPMAVEANGKKFHLSKVQRLLQNQKKLKLI